MQSKYNRVIFIFLTISSLFLAFSACRPGDEESSRESVLLQLLNLQPTEGGVWEGKVVLENCLYSSVNAGVAITGCSALEIAWRDRDALIPSNAIFTLRTEGGVPQGGLSLLLPGLDLNAALKQFDGSVALGPSTDAGLKVLSMAATDSRQGAAFRLTEFRAERLEHSISGIATAEITRTGYSDKATLRFSFNLPRTY